MERFDRTSTAPVYVRPVTVLRIGVLGAARATPDALLEPARRLPDVEVTAVAARDPERARRFARRHRIPRVHPDYDTLLTDPVIDAVYVPLPNALHATWTLRALAAGKHVLCEKPLASNAEEAARVAHAAAASGWVVMEGMHYRYHPLIQQAVDIVRGGELGRIRWAEAANWLPVPRFDGVVYDPALGGGALMVAGCYPAHALRTVLGGEPTVVEATAVLRRPGVDRAMTALLGWPDGATARLRCATWAAGRPGVALRVVGERGELRLPVHVMPQVYPRLVVRTPQGRRRVWVGGASSHRAQLAAFHAAVVAGAPVLTGPEDAVATMALIDAIYRAAGLSPRPLSALLGDDLDEVPPRRRVGE
jgi:predicted dehydrogenase